MTDLAEKLIDSLCEDREVLQETYVPFLQGNQPQVMYTVQVGLQKDQARNFYLCFDKSLTLVGYNYFDTVVKYHPDSKAADPSVLGIKKLKLNF